MRAGSVGGLGQHSRPRPHPLQVSNPASLLPIKIRLAVPTDISFVMSSWKKSLRAYSPELPDGTWYSLMNAVCAEILCGFPRIYIAHPETGDDNVILGWLCAEATDQGLILWCGYTPRAYRRESVFARLVAHAFNDLDGEAGDRTLYCPGSQDHPVRVEDYLRTELGAEHLSWAKALRLREQSGFRQGPKVSAGG